MKDIILTVLCAVIASSGFWALMVKQLELRDKRQSSHQVQEKLLLGLGHDRIMALGLKYIERGYITKDEYENLNDYLYAPYKLAGGNGSAQRIMDEVRRLPIHGEE